MSNVIHWGSPLEKLFQGKKSKTLEKLVASGLNKVSDLLWILPLKISPIPATQPFETAQVGELFRGSGKVISFQTRPNPWAKGKGKVPLQNITIYVQDQFSSRTIQLKWFNAYPSLVTNLKQHDHLYFLGEVQDFNGQHQMVNPRLEETQTLNTSGMDNFLITYPTVNTVSGSHIKKTIDKIPSILWEDIEESLPENIRSKRELIPLEISFKKFHGKFSNIDQWKGVSFDKAKERLVYEELLQEQFKIFLRRKKLTAPESKILNVNSEQIEKMLTLFPYQLTEDQNRALKDIISDFKTTRPMMRLIQGDVGCGKTTIAIVASLICKANGFQTAIMCPTEALALQHYQNFQTILKQLGEGAPHTELLLGSTKSKEKKEIKQALKDGIIDIIIGTHALIQNDIEFKDLQLSIIDEQHKFGVEQRLALSNKSEGCHCLIMTATPIPRSLSLTQYGDLDISVIKTMPSGRRGTKTRIVEPENFAKFLSFMATRLTMHEQIYVVVPAINENPDMDLLNLEQVLDKFKKLFPDYKVTGLHGQMSAEDKAHTFVEFTQGKIQMLISTSVVEVGINVPNATVMAILNPERFGLSSLHQLRGRIGRGDKPGFCFLVLDKKVSDSSTNRLKVIESSNDGFIIAEEDLKIRGEGNLFGKEQSGNSSQRKIANIIEHQSTLIEVREDLQQILEQNDTAIGEMNSLGGKDQIIYTTV